MYFIILTTVAIAFFEIYFILDLREFETPYIVALFGVKGIAFILLLNAGFLALSWRALRRKREFLSGAAASKLFFGIWGLAFLWFCDWMFIHTPITHWIQAPFLDRESEQHFQPRSSPLSFQGFVEGGMPADPRLLSIMQDRIVVNDPKGYVHVAETIIARSHERQVDPVLVFFLAYIGSFYGNATSGAMPFFDRLTPETIRRLVQFHLPAWVVESEIRQALVRRDIFPRLFGKRLGFYVRYIFHKYTLDAPIPPYALNTFSDVLLVLKEYRHEFPDLSASYRDDPLGATLGEAFSAVEGSALRPPYEDPYQTPPYGPDYYDAHREEMKTFARAAFYELVFNFDFATRVEVLHAKYNEEVLRRTLGDMAWLSIPYGQRQAMLAMPRDLYTENVGRVGYNIYSLQELNCTTIGFVADEAKKDINLLANTMTLWRPKEYEKLWGGATFRLRVFNEVWQAATGKPLAGLQPTDTAGDAIRVLRRSGNQ